MSFHLRSVCSHSRGLVLAVAALIGTTCPAAVAQGVVALRIDAGRPHEDKVEVALARCVANAFPPPPALSRDAPAGALRDALFPWLDPGVAPTTAADFAALLETKLVRERLAALGVHYIVLLSSGTGGFFTTGDVLPIPFAGFFGAGEDRKVFGVVTSIWDTKSRTVVGAGQTAWAESFGAVFVGLLIIPYYSSTESQACEEVIKCVRTAIQAPE